MIKVGPHQALGRDPFTEELAELSDPLPVHWSRLPERRDRSAGGRLRDWLAERTSILLAALCALLAAVALLVLIRSTTDARVPGTHVLASSGRGGDVPRGTPTSGADGQLPGFDFHVNEDGGYLFSYPAAWTVSNSGETTHLIGPKGSVVMTFGMAPSRGLRSASERVVAGVARPYSDVDLVTSEVEPTPQGYRSLVAGGTATDAEGNAVRFLVITIRGIDQTRVITVRFDAESDPRDSLPVIREVVASFRTSETG